MFRIFNKKPKPELNRDNDKITVECFYCNRYLTILRKAEYSDEEVYVCRRCYNWLPDLKKTVEMQEQSAKIEWASEDIIEVFKGTMPWIGKSQNLPWKESIKIPKWGGAEILRSGNKWAIVPLTNYPRDGISLGGTRTAEARIRAQISWAYPALAAWYFNPKFGRGTKVYNIDENP